MPMIPVGNQGDGYRMHSTNADMERDRIIWRMYGGYNVRNGYMYPANRFGMGSLGLRGLVPRRNNGGMGLISYSVTYDANGTPTYTPSGEYEPGGPVIPYDQTQESPAPSPAASSAPTFGTNYGSTTNNSGGVTYTAQNNDLLYQNPTGTSLVGSTQNFNPNAYATPQAAAQFAAALGGTVVVDPTSARFDQNQQMLAIRLPDGTTVNAGAIASILGNDAAYASANTKSGAIAQLIGTGYKPGIAESLLSGTPAAVDYNAAPPPTYTISPTQTAAWTATGSNEQANQITQAQASAVTGKANQSVPPQNPLTPASTGFQSTLSKLFGGSGSGDSGSANTGTGTGMSNQTLLLVALGIGAVMLMSK